MGFSGSPDIGVYISGYLRFSLHQAESKTLTHSTRIELNTLGATSSHKSSHLEELQLESYSSSTTMLQCFIILVIRFSCIAFGFKWTLIKFRNKVQVLRDQDLLALAMNRDVTPPLVRIAKNIFHMSCWPLQSKNEEFYKFIQKNWNLQANYVWVLLNTTKT